jgi:hypothetical protein
VRDALDYMMAQQEPFPAVVVDRRWNLLKANQGAVRLVEFLVGPLAPDSQVNLADALVGLDVFRPFWSTGLKSCAISFVVSRPVLRLTAPLRPLLCWTDCCLTRVCGHY